MNSSSSIRHTGTSLPENSEAMLKGKRELEEIIGYAFRPGTENFWDEGEPIKAPHIDFVPSWRNTNQSPTS